MDTRRNILLALGSGAPLLARWAWLGGNASAAEYRQAPVLVASQPAG
jgi:hypothetical protein